MVLFTYFHAKKLVLFTFSGLRRDNNVSSHTKDSFARDSSSTHCAIYCFASFYNCNISIYRYIVETLVLIGKRMETQLLVTATIVPFEYSSSEPHLLGQHSQLESPPLGTGLLKCRKQLDILPRHYQCLQLTKSMLILVMKLEETTSSTN